MLVFKTKEDVQTHLESIRKAYTAIALVPTMGALHSGHLSLVKKALKENDVVVVSIFVNPTQFNNKEDLQKYPRNLDADLKLLESVSDKLIVFAPSPENIYNSNISSESFNFDGLENEMEGKYRKGHFNGVGTIVKRLFEIIKPQKAYFGEKDYQQLLIIKNLVAKYKIPVTIIGCPILREPHGLAMSSRNERLTKEIRKQASLIYKILKQAKQKFGTESATKVAGWVKQQFLKHPQFELEYIEIANANTLKTVKRKQKNKKYRAFIAVYANNVRLIDNIALN